MDRPAFITWAFGFSVGVIYGSNVGSHIVMGQPITEESVR